MKILLAILTLFVTGSFSVTNVNEQAPKSNVIVTIEYIDGSLAAYSLEEFNKSVKGKISTNDVFTCTYGFSNGECTVTASTCELAAAGFCACAAAAGHTIPLIPICQ